jgi:hypothetical protein
MAKSTCTQFGSASMRGTSSAAGMARFIFAIRASCEIWSMISRAERAR